MLYTVSPVRHLKDGFVENQQSKSHLITAIHQVVANQTAFTSYFPSYEIMVDELRDYRFYKDDMIHPSTVAINYIWEKFQYSWIEKQASELMKDIDVVQKGMAHKPFTPASKKHKDFLKKLEEKKVALKNKYPHFKF